MTSVDTVPNIMTKLSNQISAKLLRNDTPFKAQKNNSTPETLTFLMFKRHRDITKLFELLHITDLNDKLRTNREEVELDALFQHLKDLNSVNMKL